MLRQFITTIDYAKLIEMQANSCKTKIERPKSESLKSCPKSKTKTHKLHKVINKHQ